MGEIVKHDTGGRRWKVGGIYRVHCERQYATKKSRGRQTREKKIARRQTPENKSTRPPIKWNTFKKVFPIPSTII